MLGIWENGRRGGFTSDAGMFLPSELFLQYRCFSKTDDNDRKNKNKMMQIPYLNIESMLLSRQVSHRSNSNHLIWNLEDSVLVQTLSLGETNLPHITDWFFP